MSDSTITGRVLSVVGKTVRNGTLFKVAFSDGNEYTTFENDLAQKANASVGTDVDIRFNVKQNGQWTNRYLNDLAPVGQLPPQDLQDQAGQSVDGIPMEQPRQGRGGGGGNRGMSEADKTRIAKMGSMGTAFDFVGKLYTGGGEGEYEAAKAKALELAHELYNVARSHEMAQADVQPVVTNATPQTVAAAVPGVEVGTGNVEAAAAPAVGPDW